VAISDNGSPVLSSTSRIVVSVLDINDNSPEFDQRVYKVQVPSSATVNQSIFQVCLRLSMLNYRKWSAKLLVFRFTLSTATVAKMVELPTQLSPERVRINFASIAKGAIYI